MNQTDAYMVKMISAGKTNEQIAAKLGMTPLQVSVRWEKIKAEAEANQTNGYYSLCDKFTVLVNQYQLMGETLKVIAFALGQVVPEEELVKIITSNPEETLKNLKTKTIILRAYIEPPMEVPPSLSSN